MNLFLFDPIQRYIEALLEGRRPKRFRVGSRQDLDALKMTAILSAEGNSQAAAPDPAFVLRLQEQLVLNPTEAPVETDRRGFLAAGLTGLAAGLLAGVGIGKAATTSTLLAPSPSTPRTTPRLVRDNGRWFPVARLSSLPNEAVVRFSAGALEGHLVKQGDALAAVSAICSHLPCTLVYQEKHDNFLCPCHNATFTKTGDPTRDGTSYPPLTRIQVSVKDDQVLVWSIDSAPLPPPPPST